MSWNRAHSNEIPFVLLVVHLWEEYQQPMIVYACCNMQTTKRWLSKYHHLLSNQSFRHTCKSCCQSRTPALFSRITEITLGIFLICLRWFRSSLTSPIVSFVEKYDMAVWRWSSTSRFNVGLCIHDWRRCWPIGVTVWFSRPIEDDENIYQHIAYVSTYQTMKGSLCFSFGGCWDVHLSQRYQVL